MHDEIKNETLYFLQKLSKEYPQLKQFVIPNVVDYDLDKNVAMAEEMDIDVAYFDLSLHNIIERQPELLKYYLLIALFKNKQNGV